MLTLARLLHRARNDGGFTLIETLVAMVTGIIVVGALFAILEMSAKQTSRLSQVAQATQSSNTAMTHVVDELHSACLSEGFTPVLAGSTPSSLILVNGYFPAKITEPTKEPEYTFVRKDTLEYNTGNSHLTDTYVKATAEPTSGVYSSWSTTPTTVLLAEKVSPVKVEGKEQPVFRYWEYATTPTTSTEKAATTLTEIKLGATEALTSTQANNVASVTVSFSTAPSEKKEVHLTTASEAGLADSQSTQNTFAFTAPNSESTIVAGPCE